MVAKLVILGISHLTSFISALREALVSKLVKSGILSSIFCVFLHHFLLYHLVYLNQPGQVLFYQHLIYLLYFSNCLNHSVYYLIYQYLIYLHQILN